MVPMKVVLKVELLVALMATKLVDMMVVQWDCLLAGS